MVEEVVVPLVAASAEMMTVGVTMTGKIDTIDEMRDVRRNEFIQIDFLIWLSG